MIMRYTHDGPWLDARLDYLISQFGMPRETGHTEIHHYVGRSRKWWQILYRVSDDLGQNRIDQWGTVIGYSKAQTARWLIEYYRQWRPEVLVRAM